MLRKRVAKSYRPMSKNWFPTFIAATILLMGSRSGFADEMIPIKVNTISYEKIEAVVDDCRLQIDRSYVNPWLSHAEAALDDPLDVKGRWFAFFLDNGSPLKINRLNDPDMAIPVEDEFRSVFAFRIDSICSENGSVDKAFGPRYYTFQNGTPPQIDLTQHFKVAYLGDPYLAILLCSPLKGESRSINPLCHGEVENLSNGMKLSIRIPSDPTILDDAEFWVDGIRMAETLIESWRTVQ